MSELSLNNRTALHKKSEDVEKDEDISKILQAMHKVVRTSEIPALGLAAPQIGSSKRIIIVKVGSLFKTIINPVITKRKLGMVKSKEGCLSYPGLFKTIKRYKMVYVEGFDENWKPLRLKHRGMDSYVIQHEVDHLNGITIG